MWIRLKLTAPFQRPRAPRLGFSVSPSPLPFFFDLAMTALRLNQWGLARHGPSSHFLAKRGPSALLRRFHDGPTTRPDGAMDGIDDCDVDQSFDARRFRPLVGADTLREIHELRRELIALRELLALFLLTDREFVTQARRIFECGIDDHAAFRADDLVTRTIRCTETADEGGYAFAREFHDDVDGLGHFGEATIATIGGRGPNLGRLVCEHVPRCVLAVDADIPFGAAAELAFQANVAGLHLHGELRIEIARLSNALPAHDVGDFQVAAFEMQAVRRHEVHAVALASLDHAFAVLHRRRERLFTQHVQTGRGRANSPCGMQRVRQRNVDGVDLAAAEQIARVVIRTDCLHAIAPAQLRKLGGGIGNQGGEFDVRARMLERGEYRGLCDVAESDDCEAHRTR